MAEGTAETLPSIVEAGVLVSGLCLQPVTTGTQRSGKRPNDRCLILFSLTLRPCFICVASQACYPLSSALLSWHLDCQTFSGTCQTALQLPWHLVCRLYKRSAPDVTPKAPCTYSSAQYTYSAAYHWSGNEYCNIDVRSWESVQLALRKVTYLVATAGTASSS